MLPGPFYLGFSPSWLPVHLRQRKKGHFENKLPLLARYWTATTLTGSPYYGLTSAGTVPAQARPPILSKLSLSQYKKLPGRLLLPWRIFPRHGTIAADTDFYPFGTRMFVPGYGWGEVVVVLPGQSTLDSLKIPRPVKDVLKGLNWLRSLIF